MYPVVLDANVLFPNYLRDTLLTLAELELYAPLWSEEILDEMKRNVLKQRESVTEEKADRTIALMNRAFEDALVPASAIEPLVPVMKNDKKDRHVLAAAVARGARGVVTDNVKDFPAEACDPYGITITTADEFLCVLFDLQPDDVTSALDARISQLTTPPLSLADVLVRLEEAGCKEFAKRMAARNDLGDALDRARDERRNQRSARQAT